MTTKGLDAALYIDFEPGISIAVLHINDTRDSISSVLVLSLVHFLHLENLFVLCVVLRRRPREIHGFLKLLVDIFSGYEMIQVGLIFRIHGSAGCVEGVDKRCRDAPNWIAKGCCAFLLQDSLPRDIGRFSGSRLSQCIWIAMPSPLSYV